MEDFIYERRHDDGSGTYHVTVDRYHRANVVLTGRGTVSGLKLLIDCFDEIDAMIGHIDPKVRVYTDLTRLKSAPLRAQMTLGRWMLARRERVDRVAVYGGTPFLMKIARAVVAIARLSHKVRFFRHAAEADAYLAPMPA